MQRVIEGDSYKHKGLRVDLCNLLRQRGITDEAVLAAIGRVPRHLFMDRGLDALAYEDQALPIECGQTISQPRTVAFQTQLLAVRKDMKVLEIGTGSGYQTAVLCELGARVFSVERQKGLYDVAKARLAKMHYQAKCFLGDGYQGLAQMDYGPYDRILVTCGAPEVPQPLLRELKLGGVLVVPVGDGEQEMLRIVRTADEEWETTRCGDFRFVPMLEGRQF
ncbi:MAG: protein-L-isoaspartate(D-aspartate) O-methyltransferase [Bacteroidales bacterium]|nr:protein-L-isoaspartate(D-aspartate) O-methyltransferase [Bacteroidales bacterium]